MDSVPNAFYDKKGGEFMPSALTIGPWDARLQHGGPPAALLGRALQRHGDANGVFVARVTIEMLRPMPLAPMRVEVEPVRMGRQVEWLQASLSVSGKEVARGTAVRIRKDAVEIERPNAVPAPPPSSPDGVPPAEFTFFPVEVGYHRGVEFRVVKGTWGEGPTTAWIRPRVPLVNGEEPTGLVRLLIVADAGNGIAPTLPIDRFTFVNPDMTVYLHRQPDGEWLALSARSVPAPVGVGLVQSELFDRQGEIGRSLQSLLVRARPG